MDNKKQYLTKKKNIDKLGFSRMEVLSLTLRLFVGGDWFLGLTTNIVCGFGEWVTQTDLYTCFH